MATKKYNSVAEITINDIHAYNIETFDKNASFVYEVSYTFYVNEMRDGPDRLGSLYINEHDALQSMLNRINCFCEKHDLREIQIHGGWQVDYRYTTGDGMECRHVWNVIRKPVHHTL